MGYLFWGLGDHRPPPNRRTSHIKQHLKFEQADKAVLADFMTLQSVWRSHGKHQDPEGRRGKNDKLGNI
jgi:hypothetical protein